MASYYVDETLGSDGGTGEIGDPWETISKVNGESYSAGDNIYLKKGEEWREQLVPPDSGSGGTYITFGSYGSGADPILNGCYLITPGSSWSDEGGDIWSATCTTEPHLVFFDGTEGTNDLSPDAEYDWYWAANVLYCYSTTDPDTAYTSPGVEATRYPTTDGQGLIELPSSRDYIIIDGLEVKQSQEVGIDIRSPSSYITVKNSTTSWCWHGGITAWGSSGGGCSNIIFQDNIVHDVEIIGVSGYNESITVAYTDTFEISGNTIYNYGAKEGIDAKQDSHTGQIFDNICYDGRIGIYIDSAHDIDVYRNLTYNQAWQGIILSNEMDTAACDSVDVYNNIIYDSSDGIKFWVIAAKTYGVSNIDVYNNTIYGCDNAVKWTSGTETKYSGTNNMKNNIFWALGTNWGIVDESASEVGISGTTISHNGFRTGANTETSGTDSVTTADAKFTDAGNNDYHINSDSPFRNVGADLSGIVDEDYDGNSRPYGAIYDMGAYEYMSNRLYAKGREAFLGGDIDFVNDTIKAVLVDSADYTLDLAAHDFLNDIPAAAQVAISDALAGKSITLGVADANDLTITTVSGDEFEYVILFKDTGDSATSPLIMCIDSAIGLPFTPSGGNVTLKWSNDTNKIFKL